ncbi:MAG: polysaccharide lyase family protein [Tepidisphaeraceae bacterium]
MRKNIVARRRFCSRSLLLAATSGLLAARAHAQITISQVSNSEWDIGNGDLSVVFNPSGDNITSLAIGASGNVLQPGKSEIYQETDSTGFGPGAQTYGYQQTSNYIDFWTSTASTGTTVNPITYSYHYVMFNDDPDIICYEVLNHSATDPANPVAQGQFLARVNPALFTNTYQYNVSVNNPGPQTSVVAVPSTETEPTDRTVQDSTYDLTGIQPGDWGTNFYTKYDYSSYVQNLQATVEYGSQYSVSALYTSLDSLTGGPTKQSLMFTNNISMIEFLSGHYGNSDYDYVPENGVNTTRLFGPFAFRFTPTNGETGAQLYQDSVNSMPTLEADYQTDSELISSGYVPFSQRGSIQISASNSAGWSSNVNNNMVVLSDPNKNFQMSTTGSQYWAQLSASGTASIANVAPGTYRLSMYELGQWGETRVDGVVVSGGQISIPQNLKFTPENFGTAAPIWTIGTPDRSDHEFLNGSNDTYTYAANGNVTATPVTTNGVTPGGDLRQYYGAYDYWAEEQSLGNPGKVVYYATAVGSTPATNNPLDWIANQFGTFHPGLYDASNSSTDNYANVCPAYVTAGGGPSKYSGAPWQVHFTTTSAQSAQGQYVVLSVGLADSEANLTVALNGHSQTWNTNGENTDGMIRSGDAGIYQFLVFQFPTSDLLSAGSNDEFTFSVGTSSDGDMYDALRMEITNTSAAPSTTGWYDYDFVSGAPQVNANDAVGLAAVNEQIPEPASLGVLALGSILLVRRRTCRGT